MAGLLLTVGSIGVMFASGIAVSTAMTFLHNFEIDVNKKDKNKNLGGRRHDSKINDLSKRIKSDSNL